MNIYMNEMYGPVLQGEGPDAGRPFIFLRLAQCNLDCSWCDTPYSWDWKRYDRDTERHPVDVVELATGIVEQWQRFPQAGLVITGGEPLLQQKALVPLLTDLPLRVAVETNGTIVPSDELVPLVTSWAVSPKLANAGVDPNRAIKPKALAAFGAMHAAGAQVALKVVVEGPHDMYQVEQLRTLMDVPPDAVWVMPQGRSALQVVETARHVEPQVLLLGYNLTIRNQVVMHGDGRGV